MSSSVPHNPVQHCQSQHGRLRPSISTALKYVPAEPLAEGLWGVKCGNTFARTARKLGTISLQFQNESNQQVLSGGQAIPNGQCGGPRIIFLNFVS